MTKFIDILVTILVFPPMQWQRLKRKINPNPYPRRPTGESGPFFWVWVWIALCIFMGLIASSISRDCTLP